MKKETEEAMLENNALRKNSLPRAGVHPVAEWLLVLPGGRSIQGLKIQPLAPEPERRSIKDELWRLGLPTVFQLHTLPSR